MFKQTSFGSQGRAIAYLGKPTSYVIPADAHNVPTFQGPATRVVTSTVLEQCAIAEAKIVDQTRVRMGHKLSLRCFFARVDMRCRVATDETFVSFTYDIRFAASERSWKGELHVVRRNRWILDT